MRLGLVMGPVLVAGLLLAGCAGADNAGGGRIDDMWGKTYLSTVVTEDGKARPLVAGTTIRLSFEKEGEIGAYAGCNHLFGTADVDAEKVTVSDMGGTEMGCSPELHEQDEWLTRFLTAGPRWDMTGDELILKSEGTELRLLDRRVADPDRSLAGTKWIVDGLISGESVSSVPADAEAFLTIGDDGKVTGNTGCNNMGGSAEVAAGKVTFGDLFTTKIGCMGDIAALEQAVLAVLNGEVSYTITAGSLTLTHPSGKGLQLRAER